MNYTTKAGKNAQTILVPRCVKASFGSTIVDTMINPELCRGQFSDASWSARRVLLAGFHGLPMNEAELALFRRITALPGPAQVLLLELWLAVGRRG